MITLFIADDHTIFRNGLINLLVSSKIITIVGEASNGHDALEKILSSKPDIAILDVSMPGLTGIEIAVYLYENKIPTKIILLTMHSDPELVINAKKNGVKGYVLKEDVFDNLLKAIRAVYTGRTYMSTIIEEKLDKHEARKELSKRELSVLKMIAEGKTNNEIAKKLNISSKTVETYRARLMQKLGLHSIAELTKHALKIGLVA